MSGMAKVGLFFSVILSFTNANAISIGDKPDSNTLGEQCRQKAVKMDLLSRYQDRALCTNLLNGQDVYFASQYIIANRGTDAKNLLAPAIIRVKYATDIGCYGQGDLKDLTSDLQTIFSQL